jgi:methionine-rich copper-binding protein CopC
VAATIAYVTITRTATLQPAVPLSTDASYQVTLSGAVTDLVGNPLGANAAWSFATLDTAAPTILARSPAPGATGVGTAQVVSVSFSEPMNAATIAAAAFRLRAAGSATDVAATISYDPATRTATLRPAAPLSANTGFQVTLSGTVTDLAGNPLGADATWGFTTVDTIAPTVVARSPAPGATGVAAGTAVTVTFGEAMAAGTINGTTFQLRGPANSLIAATVSYNAGTNTATLTPSAPLAGPATFTVTVAGATDLAGNALTAPVTWSFTTADAPPTVIAQSPAPGATAVAPGTTVTVTFSESIQSKTLSFVLKTASGTTVATKVSYNDVTRTATLTPNSALQSATTYTVTVSGAKDLTGKTMTAPVVWSFTTVVPWIQTTLNDFATGTNAGTMATNTGGGEVQLAAASVFEDFNGATALPSTWTSLSFTPSGGGPTSVVVSGGVLSVAGAYVVSNQTFVNAPVEGRVQFGAAANQSFGATNDAGTSFAVFTTKNTTNSLYAQVNANGLIKELRIGALPSGFHVYRVTPVATGFQFYVDGSLKATVAQTLPAGTPLKASVSAFYGSPRPAILADWVHVLSYASGGVFTSSVFDATRTATWGTFSFTGTVPAGTTMIVEVSSGNTATRDGTWSSWTRATSGGAISAPSGRYLQYRVTFTTTNSTVTAVLNDVTVTWR